MWRSTEVMKRSLTIAIWAIIAVMFNSTLYTGSVKAVEIDWPEPNWPEIFDSNALLTLHLQIDPADWNTILHDSPDANGCIDEPIEVPAWFWMAGEEHLKIKVSVRRKNGSAFPDETNPQKVALKIDINEYYPTQGDPNNCDPCAVPGEPGYCDPNAAPDWHGLKKLSLETNSDAIADVVSEGLSCNLHRMASVPQGYGYDAWHANWVKLYVNGDYKGIYVNNEQRDKQFLRNRGIYVSHNSWMYKYENCEPGFSLDIGDDDFPKSPAIDALCYEPFVNEGNFPDLMPSGGVCPIPNDVNVIADMNQWVNMQGLLAMTAVDAFIANSDCLFSHGQEAFFHDFNLLDPSETRKRMYFPWDNDGITRSLDWDIYHSTTSVKYSEVILGKPVFRNQYNQIMRDLLGGPLSETNIYDFLNSVEPVLTPAIEADPWAMSEVTGKGYSTVVELFDSLRSWISQRITNVLAQIDFDEHHLPPGIVLLNDGFEGAVWDANWTGTWAKDTTTYCRGLASAHADKNNSGDFICDALDTTAAVAVNIDFYLKKDNVTSYNPKLYYYNGISYVDVCDIDGIGADDEWLHYTDEITDSNFFVPDFRIKFTASLGSGGSPRNIWLDDVVVTKHTPCSVANLDGLGLVNFEDFTILAEDWQLTGPGLPGDITGNEVVDIYDLAEIVQYWLKDCSAP